MEHISFDDAFMRRIISILFLSLMLLQAIPVLHFFSSQKEIFYTYIDEEKPDEKFKEKKECKEFLSTTLISPVEQTAKTLFSPIIESHYISPKLEFVAPPPDFC